MFADEWMFNDIHNPSANETAQATAKPKQRSGMGLCHNSAK